LRKFLRSRVVVIGSSHEGWSASPANTVKK
jgi:hypothetical protein